MAKKVVKAAKAAAKPAPKAAPKEKATKKVGKVKEPAPQVGLLIQTVDSTGVPLSIFVASPKKTKVVNGWSPKRIAGFARSVGNKSIHVLDRFGKDTEMSTAAGAYPEDGFDTLLDFVASGQEHIRNLRKAARKAERDAAKASKRKPKDEEPEDEVEEDEVEEQEDEVEEEESDEEDDE